MLADQDWAREILTPMAGRVFTLARSNAIAKRLSVAAESALLAHS